MHHQLVKIENTPISAARWALRSRRAGPPMIPREPQSPNCPEPPQATQGPAHGRQGFPLERGGVSAELKECPIVRPPRAAHLLICPLHHEMRIIQAMKV